MSHLMYYWFQPVQTLVIWVKLSIYQSVLQVLPFAYFQVFIGIWFVGVDM